MRAPAEAFESPRGRFVSRRRHRRGRTPATRQQREGEICAFSAP